jgi:hypothetical protein
MTDALSDQRERSLSGVMAWALDLASRGVVRTQRGQMPWRSFFATRELYEDFCEWVGAQRFERALSVNTFGRELGNVLGLQRKRRAGTSEVVPEAVRDAPGFCMPATPNDFEQLVRGKAGLRNEEPCSAPLN